MNALAAYLVGSLVFVLLAAVFGGLSSGRPWLGGVVMMLAGLVALGVVL